MYPVNIASREKGIRDWSVNYLKRSLEIASQMEAPRTLITIGQGYRNDPGMKHGHCCRDSLLQLAEYAGKMGTTIMLEHLTNTTTNLCVTASQLKDMLQETGGPSLKAMVDVDMAARVGEGPREYWKPWAKIYSMYTL